MITHPMLQMREPPPEIDVFLPPINGAASCGTASPSVCSQGTTTDATDQSTVAPPSTPEREAPADGWIEWKGGECPSLDRVDVRLRDGKTGFAAGFALDWSVTDGPGDIIAYRVCK